MMNEYVILTTPACSLFNNNKCKLFYEPSATVWRILNLWRSLGQKGFWDGFNFKSHPLCCHFVDWSKQKCSYFLSEFIVVGQVKAWIKMEEKRSFWRFYRHWRMTLWSRKGTQLPAWHSSQTWIFTLQTTEVIL